MKFKYTFILFQLLNCIVFSQEKDETYYKSILLSGKAGYHTGYNLQSERGFPDGIVYDGCINFGVNSFILIGLNVEYWEKNNVEIKSGFTNNVLYKSFSGLGYIVHFQLRKTLFDFVNTYIDLGIGRYTIAFKYNTEGYFISGENSYLNTGLSMGVGYRISKKLLLSGEVSIYGLLNADSRNANITNFKFGPTFILQLK